MSSTPSGSTLRVARGRYTWLAVWTVIWIVLVAFVLIVGPEDVESCRAQAQGNTQKFCGVGTLILQVAVGLAIVLIWAPVALILLVVAVRARPVTRRCPACQAEMVPGSATCPNCKREPPGVSAPPTGSG